MNNPVDRRALLRGIGALSLGGMLSPVARAADLCRATPAQTEGPFYPTSFPVDDDADLTRVVGHALRAEGEYILIHGEVLDPDCQPVAGAHVQIWQACASGKYNHPDDTNSAPLDPHFQYYGQAVSGADGGYAFLTVKPGSYPNSPTWERPPHVHFKVSAPGFAPLTTQMYFMGEPLNLRDNILRALSAVDRRMVIVRFNPAQPGDAFDAEGAFDISLAPAGGRGTPEFPDEHPHEG